MIESSHLSTTQQESAFKKQTHEKKRASSIAETAVSVVNQKASVDYKKYYFGNRDAMLLTIYQVGAGLAAVAGVIIMVASVILRNPSSFSLGISLTLVSSGGCFLAGKYRQLRSDNHFFHERGVLSNQKELETLQGQNKELEGVNGELFRKNEELRQEHQVLEEKLVRIGEKLTHINERTQELESDNEELKKDNAKLQSRIHDYNELRDELSLSVRVYEEENQELRGLTQRLKGMLKSLSDGTRELQKENQQAYQENEAMREQWQKMRASVRPLREKNGELEKQIVDLQGQLETFEQKTQTQLERIQELEEENRVCTELEERIEELEQNKVQLKTEVEAAALRLKQVEEAWLRDQVNLHLQADLCESLKRELLDAQEGLQDLTTQWQTRERSWLAEKAELQTRIQQLMTVATTLVIKEEENALLREDVGDLKQSLDEMTKRILSESGHSSADTEIDHPLF